MKTPYEAVIGVWDGHDAGAALVIDGRVVLALNEERLSGRKLDVGLPVRAVAAMRAAAAPPLASPISSASSVAENFRRPDSS